MDKEKLKRYFRIVKDITEGKKVPSKDDLKFFADYTPQIDEKAIADFESQSGDAKNLRSSLEGTFLPSVMLPLIIAMLSRSPASIFLLQKQRLILLIRRKN